MDETRIKEVFSDEALVKRLLTLEEPEDVQTALKEKGLEVSMEEVLALGEYMTSYMEKLAQSGERNGELTVEQLEDVAGGFAPMLIVPAIGILPIAAPAFTAAVIGVVGAAVVTGISIVKGWRW